MCFLFRDAVEPSHVEQIFARAKIVVEAGTLRQIADPFFDLDRLGGRVEAAHRDLAGCRFRQAQEHQDGRGLARAIGAEKAEDFALLNRQIKRVDREFFAVALAEIFGVDNRAHRRPKRKNTIASPSTTKPTMPKPIQPQIVGVDTVTRNSTDLVTSGELAVSVNR